MENPLFGSTAFPPTPSDRDGFNPVYSTQPRRQAPNTARGMRTLADINPFDLQSGAGAPNTHPQHALAISPLPTNPVPTAPARQRLEEREFAEILSKCMRGEMDPPDALLAYADACRARAADLRDYASSQLQRASRYMSLNATADELDAEAATWRLMWHLHGVTGRDFPAGVGGGFVEGAGFAKTYRQHAADLLFQDETLNRAARTVAWLESLAAESADKQPPAPFSATDGLWQETLNRLTSGTASRPFTNRNNDSSSSATALVTALDPDAPTRQKRRLHPDNTREEDRLMEAVWTLIRSGKLAAARQLCEDVGQPWRAVSLGGGGAQGPLPLGPAAADADALESASSHEAAETLSCEVEHGTGTQRALWKWTCYQAAERISETATATGQGKYEAGVYAALAGHLGKVLPVCSSWEDRAWAMMRCWLDCVVDKRLGSGSGNSGNGADASNSASSSMTVVVPSVEALGSTAAHDAARQAAQVQQRGWPIEAVEDQLPSTFEEVVTAATSVHNGGTHSPTPPAKGGGTAAAATRDTYNNTGSGSGGSSSSKAALRHREVQSALILDRIEALVRDCLVRWILDGVSVPVSDPSPGNGNIVEESSKAAVNGGHVNGGGFVDDGSEGPACPPGLMRFAAHLSLALWALGVASTPEDGAPSAAYSALHDLLQRLVQVYAVHLVDSGAHDLVPPYTCHLRSGLRHTTYLLFMEHLVAQGDFEGCRRAHRLGKEWFSAWSGGDVARNEMAIISEKAISKAHLESVGGPINRAWEARWLSFDTSTATAAVRWANILCREFSLGGEGGIAAAAELLGTTMPLAAGNGGLETIITSAEAAGAVAGAQELRAWAFYFDLQTEYLCWQRLMQETTNTENMDDDDDNTTTNQTTTQSNSKGLLKQQTLELLSAGESFLRDDCFNALVGPDSGLLDDVEKSTLEIAVVVGPHPRSLPEDHSEQSEVLSGQAYPTYASDNDRSKAAEELVVALRDAAAANGLGGGSVTFAAGAAPDGGGVHLPGLISVAVECAVGQAGQQQQGEDGETPAAAAVLLLSLALKGELLKGGGKDSSSSSALVVVNVDAPQALSAALCRCICLPRLALMCADLRRAAAEMGHVGNEGRAVVEIVAGSDLTPFFSKNEMRCLLALEREAVVLQLRNGEQQRKRAGGGDGFDGGLGEQQNELDIRMDE